MRVHLYRRKGEGPYWQAQVYVGGKRYPFSCETDDKDTAREYARQRLGELKARHNRGLIGLPEPIRMSVVFDRYEREYAPSLRPSSRKRTMTVIREARAWFESGPLHDPYVADVTGSDTPTSSPSTCEPWSSGFLTPRRHRARAKVEKDAKAWDEVTYGVLA